jgi:hypothetical protein
LLRTTLDTTLSNSAYLECQQQQESLLPENHPLLLLPLLLVKPPFAAGQPPSARSCVLTLTLSASSSRKVSTL